MQRNYILAVLAAAVLAVAAVGVGYAYTATTSNSGNDVDQIYLTLDQTSITNGFEDNRVVFDSKQIEDNKMAYWFDKVVTNDESSTTVPSIAHDADGNIDGKEVYPMGSTQINVKGTSFTGYTFTVTPSETGFDSNVKYYIGIASANPNATIKVGEATKSWAVLSPSSSSTPLEFNVSYITAATTDTLTVSLYVINVVQGQEAGGDAAETWQQSAIIDTRTPSGDDHQNFVEPMILENATFTFQAEIVYPESEIEP